jgi:DNA-binding NtrC family response regulator
VKRARGIAERGQPEARAPELPDTTPTLRAVHPAAARWIGALIRMTAPHPAMTRILDVVERLQDRPYRTNFVLLGEPGTGKEGLARALHHLSCPEGPLVRFDVTGFSDDEALAVLTGSGRVRGAAHHADGGTLLVEEAAGLGARTQAALIRLLKSGRVDDDSDEAGEGAHVGPGPGAGVGAHKRRLRVHAIVMSDRDLEGEVRAGRFRHDLYWRLARVVLALPPLRERVEDLGPSAVWMGNRILRDAGLPLELMLSEDFQRAAGAERRRAVELSADAIDALAAHDWPGNFRELEAVLERALLLYRSGPTLDGAAIRAALS